MYKRIFDIENQLDEAMFLFGARQVGKSWFPTYLGLTWPHHQTVGGQRAYLCDGLFQDVVERQDFLIWKKSKALLHPKTLSTQSTNSFYGAASRNKKCHLATSTRQFSPILATLSNKQREAQPKNAATFTAVMFSSNILTSMSLESTKEW